MAYHFGKTGYLACQIQSAPGVADVFSGGTGEFGFPITDQPDLKPVIEKEFKNYYKKSMAEYSDYTVKSLSASGGIEVPAFPGGPLEFMLYSAMGNKTTQLHAAETAVWDNTFKIDTAGYMPISTIAVGRDALNYQRFYDCRFGSFEMDFKAGDDVTLKADIEGRGGDISQAAFTPSYTTDRSFAFDDAYLSIGGSVNCDVTELNIKLDRGIKSIRTMCDVGSKGNNMIYSTGVDVTGSVELFFQDYDEYKYWLGGAAATEPTFDQTAASTKRTMVLTMEGAAIGTASKNKMVMTLPRIVYETSEIDMPFDDRMRVKFDFMGLNDPAIEAQYPGTGTINAVVTSKLNGALLT